jgi:hypothetical protein
MTTGLHVVVDIFCRDCNSDLGWRYVRLVVASRWHCLHTLTRTTHAAGGGLRQDPEVQGGQVHSGKVQDCGGRWQRLRLPV